MPDPSHRPAGGLREEKRSPVGRPDFKSGRGRATVSGGFDSHSLPPRPRRGQPLAPAGTSEAGVGTAFRCHGISAQPIAPPPCLVITITEGRGGMSGWKSGHRVDGLSKLEPFSSPGCWIAAK